MTILCNRGTATPKGRKAGVRVEGTHRGRSGRARGSCLRPADASESPAPARTLPPPLPTPPTLLPALPLCPAAEEPLPPLPTPPAAPLPSTSMSTALFRTRRAPALRVRRLGPPAAAPAEPAAGAVKLPSRAAAPVEADPMPEAPKTPAAPPAAATADVSSGVATITRPPTIPVVTLRAKVLPSGLLRLLLLPLTPDTCAWMCACSCATCPRQFALHAPALSRCAPQGSSRPPSEPPAVPGSPASRRGRSSAPAAQCAGCDTAPGACQRCAATPPGCP